MINVTVSLVTGSDHSHMLVRLTKPTTYHRYFDLNVGTGLTPRRFGPKATRGERECDEGREINIKRHGNFDEGS